MLPCPGMAAGSDIIAHVLDLLGGWRGIAARRMFGGHGLFRDGMMFGLVVDETLYLKVDERNRPAFVAAGMRPFTYRRATRAAPVELSYWQAPAEILDDAEEMARWARGAWEAALAARDRKPGRGRKLSGRAGPR